MVKKIKNNKTKKNLAKTSMNFKTNQKTKTASIDKELRKIYQDEKGKIPKMTDFEFKEKNRALRFIIYAIIALAVLFIVSVLGFLFFQPAPKFTDNKVNLEIKAPFTANSGENITYQLKYTNSEEITLTQTQLNVYLPNGFILEDESQPSLIKNGDQDQKSNVKTWVINDLAANQSGTLELKGRLVGSLNSKQTISAILSYIPANFSSEFQKNVSFTTEINGSLLSFETEYPNQVANQEENEFNLKITNNSKDVSLENLQLELNYPPNFTLTASQIIEPGQEKGPFSPEETEEDVTQKIWSIDSLANQSTILLNFKGKFDVSETSTEQLNLKLKLKGPTDEYFSQQEKDLGIEVVKGELLSNLIIQGSNQNKPVNFGDQLTYTLNIQNKSKNTLGDLKVRAVLDSIFLDWSTLKDDNNGLKDSNQILWTKDQIPDLALMLPEEEVTINFQITLKDFSDSKKYKEEDYQVKSFFETQINKIDNKGTELVNESNTLINLINTNLTLDAEGRYFDDNNQTVGSGPLPPIVGQKTTYKIYWIINNSLHEIKDIEVRAKLPDYINYEDQENISTGNLFKNRDNEIVWQISRIPTSITEAKAEFSISLTPQTADVEKILTLLPEIQLQATDSQTNGKIYLTATGITTNLDTDPLGKGKGLIQPE